MPLHGFAADEEPESGSRDAANAERPIARLEDVRPFIGRNPHAVIAHGHLCHVAIDSQIDLDVTTAG